MYADTPNYKKSTDKATYYNNWLKQTVAVIDSNKDIEFIRVIDDEFSFVPKELTKLNNLKHISVEKFKEIYTLD
jgi:hypothetical protein